jgi:hypothetical protein
LADIFTDELAGALRLSGCPVCRVAAADEQRWLETWWREGRNSKEGRQRFYDGGGFCTKHAWLLHDVCRRNDSGAAIAAVYGPLVDRDLALLAEIERSIVRPRRRGTSLRRAASCSACVAAAEETERRAYFLAELLRSPGARTRYADCDGLCFAHLAAAIGVASRDAPDVARFLLHDWKRRLEAVRQQLAEFDRKRDHRYLDEPKGREQESWTEVIDLYVGPREP